MKVKKMNKQNETVLLEHLADTFETKLREADRSIGAIIRLTSESDKLVAVFLAGLLGVALLLASLFLPSHNDAHVSEPPTLSEQIERTWGLDEMGDCKNTSHGLTDSPSLPKSSLDDGDWKCVAYTDSQRTELTVHINGNKVGLYEADGKALKLVGKD